MLTQLTVLQGWLRIVAMQEHLTSISESIWRLTRGTPLSNEGWYLRANYLKNRENRLPTTCHVMQCRLAILTSILIAHGPMYHTILANCQTVLFYSSYIQLT